MIIAIVTFDLPKKWSVEDAAAVFKSTAPKYLGKSGLVRKHYWLSQAGERAGGMYFWETRAAAEACYTKEWQAMVTDKYGAPPRIEFLHAPVTVDNTRHAIEAD
jgi:hypothetical protein